MGETYYRRDMRQQFLLAGVGPFPKLLQAAGTSFHGKVKII